MILSRKRWLVCVLMAAATCLSVVRGHHIYKQMWTPHVGEKLQIKREENNENDLRTVAVLKDSAIVGHLLREIARNVFFLARGGTGECEITGRRKKGKGLGVLCVYTFRGPNKLIKRLESLLSKQNLCSCPY